MLGLWFQKGHGSVSGQASLEMLLLATASICFLGLAASQTSMLLSGARHAAIKHNVDYLLESCQEACQEAVLSGAVREIEFTALSEGVLNAGQGRIMYSSEEFNMSMGRFGCKVNQGVRKGKNTIRVYPE